MEIQGEGAHVTSTCSRSSGRGVASALLVSIGAGAAWARPTGGGVHPPDHAVHFVGTIPFPAAIGPSAAFDISWVDQSTGRYFFADETHQAVAWFDAATNTFVGLLAPGLFAGSGTAACHTFTSDPFGCGGPTGVLTDDLGRVWAGDSPTSSDPSSSVAVIDPTTNATTVIDTGGHARSDELAFDPVDHMVLVANPDDGFLTWISTTTLSVVGKFYYSGNADGVTPTVANHPATGGLEQPVFDPQTGLFYQAVPGVGIDVFNPVPVNGVGQLVTTFDTPPCMSGPTCLVPRGTVPNFGGSRKPYRTTPPRMSVSDVDK